MTVSAAVSYQEHQINTARRGQLLLLAYDGLLGFLAKGKRAIEAKHFDEQNTYLTKAQDILVELTSSLDHSAHPKLCENLSNLYTYMYDRLVQANIQDDAIAVSEVAGQLAELRAAWAEADQMLKGQQAASSRGGFSA